MPSPESKREVGRGERVLPGVWRLRLPLPWPGIPHGNAWAIAAGDGVVLVDCGMHGPGSVANLERALAQCNLRIEHVRLLVCTHAHSDHYGQAATIVDRAGCELWMHPRHEHMAFAAGDRTAAIARRLEIARQSGVPEAPLLAWAERAKEVDYGVARVIEPHRDLVPGVEVETDLGPLSVHYTPGHCPSHVCLFESSRRLLFSGDHLLGRISLFFEHGYSPDPCGEFLDSLDRVEALDPRLALSGHGRTFTDVAGHVAANRALVAERLDATRGALAHGPLTAFDATPLVHGSDVTRQNAAWWLSETLVYLEHLERVGEAVRERGDGGPDSWSTLT